MTFPYAPFQKTTDLGTDRTAWHWGSILDWPSESWLEPGPTTHPENSEAWHAPQCGLTTTCMPVPKACHTEFLDLTLHTLNQDSERVGLKH